MNESTREKLCELAKNEVFGYLTEERKVLNGEKASLIGISIENVEVVAVVVAVSANARYRCTGSQTKEEDREIWVRIAIDNEGKSEATDFEEL